MDVDMHDTKTRPAVDPSIFHKLQESIDRDAAFKDEIREVTKDLDRINRQISFILSQCHSTPAKNLPNALEPCKEHFEAQRNKVQELATIASRMPYYKYNGLFSSQLQNAAFSAIFAHWLGYPLSDESNGLLSLEQVGQILGVKVNVGDEDCFHLTTEEYLHALISLINEMSRLAVNSVTIGDLDRPQQISTFIKELFSAFQILNLKNDSLRRRYDSIKYDVKKVEEVVYDLSLRQSESAAYLKVKKLTETAQVPTRGSAHAAGYDIYASEECTIPGNGGRALVSTGLSIAVPPDCYARIAPRSGLAVKNGISTGAGVVDSDYRGEVRVLLFNQSPQEFRINAGDRIAQMVLERVYTPRVEETQNLEESVRGEGGFGSTGQ